MIPEIFFAVCWFLAPVFVIQPLQPPLCPPGGGCLAGDVSL